MADFYRPVQTETRRELDKIARERGSDGVTFQLGGSPKLPTDFEKSLREGGYYEAVSPDAAQELRWDAPALSQATAAEQLTDPWGYTVTPRGPQQVGPMVPPQYERTTPGPVVRPIPHYKRYHLPADKSRWDKLVEKSTSGPGSSSKILTPEEYAERNYTFEVNAARYELEAMSPEESGIYPMPRFNPIDFQTAFQEMGTQMAPEDLKRVSDIVTGVTSYFDKQYGAERGVSERQQRIAAMTGSPYAQTSRFGQEPLDAYGVAPFYGPSGRDYEKLFKAIEAFDVFEKITIMEEVGGLEAAVHIGGEAGTGAVGLGGFVMLVNEETRKNFAESPMARMATGQITRAQYRKELLDRFNALPTKAQWALYIGAPHNLIPLGPLDDIFKALLKGGVWTLRGTRVGPRGVIKGIPDYGGGVLGQFPGLIGGTGTVIKTADQLTALVTRPIIRGVNDAASAVARGTGRAAYAGFNTAFPVEVAYAAPARYGFPNEPTSYDELYLRGLESEYGTAFGPEGQGQFIITPGDETEVAAFKLWQNSNVGPDSPNLALRKSIRRNLDNAVTLSKEMLTDVFARSHNLQKRIHAEYDRIGEKMPDYMKVGTIMAAARGGTHSKAFGRYAQVTNAVARQLGGLNAGWVNDFLKLAHGLDVMKMHPGRIDASTGYTPEIYTAHMRQLHSQIEVIAGPDAWNKVKHASELVRDEYQLMLDERVTQGLVDAELAVTLKQDYPWYNTIRYMESQNFGININLYDDIASNNNRVVGNSDNGLRHLADISMDVYDQQDAPLNVLLSAILRHEHLMAVNEAADSMVMALLKDPSSAVMVRKRGTIVVDLTGQVLGAEGPARSIEYLYAGKTALAQAEGAVYRVLDDDVKAMVERPGARKIRGRMTRRTEDTEIIQVWEGGKPVMYEVPAWAAENLKHLVDFDQSLFERVLRAAQAPFRAALTAYNPAFMAANWLHEMWVLGAVHGIMPWDMVINTGHAMKNIFKEDRLLVEMTENRGLVLGLTGDVQLAGVGRGRGDIRKGGYDPRNLKAIGKKYGVSEPGGSFVLRDSRDYKRFMSAKGVLRGLNAVSQALEVSSRRTLYESGINRGMSPAASAAFAREGMVDYARWGTAIHLADAAFLYLNAGLQGALMPIRAITGKNPGARRRAAMGLLGYTGITAGIYAHNRQFKDPENNYYDIPLRERLGGLVIMLPGGKRQADGSYKPNYINILPFARELAFLSGSMTFMLEKLDGRVEGGIGTLLTGIIDQVNPLSAMTPFESQGSSMPKLQNVPYPTQVGELVSEMADNYDNFRKRPIVDPATEGLPASERFNADTSDTAKSISKLVPLEPPYIDHMIKFGGVTRDIVAGADYVARMIDPDRVPQEVQDIVGQLFIISDSWPDDMVALKQREYLNELDPAIVDLKAVNMEFRKQQRDHNYPVLSSVTDRVIGDGGYERARHAKDHAITSAGASLEATKLANKQLSNSREISHKMQWASDNRLETGEIDPRKWRKERRLNSAIVHTSLLALTGQFPTAIQVIKGRAGYSGYIEAIATMSGLWPDERTKGELLYSGWVGLEHQIFPEEMSPTDIGIAERHADPTPLFRAQEEFWNALSTSEQKLLIDERTSRATPTERLYIEDMQTLMPYFKVDTDVLKILVGQEKEGWERYMAATTTTMKNHLIQEYELQGVIGEVDDRKLYLREIEEIGIALNRWQFVDPKQAITIAAEVERLKRVERVTSYQETNPQAVGAGQSP